MANCDVLIIGGGHAGAEAAWSAAANGANVVLLTLDRTRIGQMSCNPAIGGLAKGQMVREVDALGGLMGRAIDATGIQFRMLKSLEGAGRLGTSVHRPTRRNTRSKYNVCSRSGRICGFKPAKQPTYAWDPTTRSSA